MQGKHATDTKATTHHVGNFKMKCSDCGRYDNLSRWELRQAARPRCSHCGGPLNKPSQA